MFDEFPQNPATVVFDTSQGDQTWIGTRVFFEQNIGEHTGPTSMVLQALGEERVWPIETIEKLSDGEWRGTVWTEPDLDDLDDPEARGQVDIEQRPLTFTLRKTLPRDAESAISLQGSGMQIPMPIELISYIHASDGDFPMPQLFALSDDEGFVATLLLSAPTGLYVRYASLWHPVTDPDVVDGLNANEVDPAALELFDERERQGQLPSVVSLTSVEGGSLDLAVPGTVTTGPETTVETTPMIDEAIAASGGRTLVVPIFSNAEDLPSAIAAAMENPDIRWWVERRMGALGLEAELPWE